MNCLIWVHGPIFGHFCVEHGGSDFVKEKEAREDYKMAQNPRQKGGTNTVEAYLSLSLLSF